jgi:hypothetical protein
MQRCVPGNSDHIYGGGGLIHTISLLRITKKDANGSGSVRYTEAARLLTSNFNSFKYLIVSRQNKTIKSMVFRTRHPLTEPTHGS